MGRGQGLRVQGSRLGFLASPHNAVTDEEPFRSVYFSLECSPGRDKECQ